MSDNTQLTSAEGYNTKRMIFSKPNKGTIPNSTISYTRVNISTKNENGTVGDLIIPTTEVFSFGVSENRDLKTKEVNGYVLPLCLWNRDGATPEEKTWIETFNSIVEECKSHLLANKEELEQDIIYSDLRKFNPLYWKMEKGKRVKDRGPTLYPKLIQSGKKGQSREESKIISIFYDEQGESLNPRNLLGKYCYVNAAVKIESIFIGSKISLQVKLHEASVRLISSGMKRLLSRPKGDSRLLSANSNPMLENKTDDLSDDDNDNVSDQGSIVSSDNDDQDTVVNSDETKSPVPVKKKKSPVKKKKKRVVKKIIRTKKST